MHVLYLLLFGGCDKHLDPKQIKEQFILAYSFGGVDDQMEEKVRQQEQEAELSHFSHKQEAEREKEMGWGAEASKPDPHWCASSLKAQSPDGPKPFQLEPPTWEQIFKYIYKLVWDIYTFKIPYSPYSPAMEFCGVV